MGLSCFLSTSAPQPLWPRLGAGLEAGVSPGRGISQHLPFSFLLFPQEHLPSALGRCSLPRMREAGPALCSSSPDPSTDSKQDYPLFAPLGIQATARA